jgi:hypothetical protein
MSTTTCVSGKTDSGGHASDNGLAVLARSFIGNQAGGTATDSQSVSFNAASTALWLETTVVVLGLVEMMHPNGERPGGIGTAVEVVASVLDIETHVILASWSTVSETRGIVEDSPGPGEYEPKSTPSFTCSGVEASIA